MDELKIGRKKTSNNVIKIKEFNFESKIVEKQKKML